MAAFMGKKEVPLETALVRASEVLMLSRMPVISGLGADVAAMRAAMRLAAQLGGALDFCRGPASMNLLSAAMDKGLLFTTPQEARSRADVLLLLGPGVGRSEAIVSVLEGQPALSAGEGARRDVLWLCPNGANASLARFDVAVAEADIGAIHGILGMLNALIRSRPMEQAEFAGLSRQDFEEMAGRLMTARFGVIAFSPQDLDPLAIEALVGFAHKLSQATRVTLLPVVHDVAAHTAALVSAWTAGFPPRLGFSRGYPEFDFWRFDAARLTQSGECDALLWLSPFEAKGPDWRADIPVIAVMRPGAVFARAPEIIIETGVPGVDIDAEIYSGVLQTLLAASASRRTSALCPAAVLDRVLAHLEILAA